MSTKTIYFIAVFFVALALGPALAHLLELPNKINLGREDYLTVQQIYRGWASMEAPRRKSTSIEAWSTMKVMIVGFPATARACQAAATSARSR